MPPTNVLREITKIYSEGGSGPNGLGTGAVVGIGTEYARVAKLITKYPFYMSPEQENDFTAWTGNDTIVLDGVEQHAHIVAKAAQHHCKEKISAKLKHCGDILIIGGSYSEAKFFKETIEPDVIHIVIGNISARDTARVAMGDIAAKRDVQNGRNCEMAEDYLSRGKTKGFFFFGHKWPERKYDAIIAVDSLYDVDRLDLAHFMDRTKTKVCIFTMHMVAELFTTDWTIVRNKIFHYEWLFDPLNLPDKDRKNKGRIMMRFYDENSLSYMHNVAKYSFWTRNTAAHDGAIKCFWEPVHFKYGYGLFTFHTHRSADFFGIKHYYSTENGILRIFDAGLFLKNKRITTETPYYVDAAKFYQTIEYILATKDDTIVLSKVVDYIRSIAHSLIIGGRTLSKKWEYMDTPFVVILGFVMLYASLQKREMGGIIRRIAQLIKSGKEADFIEEPSMWENFCKWLLALFGMEEEEQKTLLQLIEGYMYFKPGYDYIDYKNVQKIENECTTKQAIASTLKIKCCDHEIEDFKDNTLVHSHNRHGYHSHAAYKLSLILGDFKHESVLHLGVEPGGMAKLLMDMDVKCELVTFLQMLPKHKIDLDLWEKLTHSRLHILKEWEMEVPVLHKKIYRGMETMAITETTRNVRIKGTIPRLLAFNQQMLVVDTACCSNFKCPKHFLFITDSIKLFLSGTNTNKAAIIKYSTFNLDPIRMVSEFGYTLHFHRVPHQNPLSFETYISIAKKNIFCYQSHSDRLKNYYTIMKPIVDTWNNFNAWLLYTRLTEVIPPLDQNMYLPVNASILSETQAPIRTIVADAVFVPFMTAALFRTDYPDLPPVTQYIDGIAEFNTCPSFTAKKVFVYDYFGLNIFDQIFAACESDNIASSAIQLFQHQYPLILKETIDAFNSWRRMSEHLNMVSIAMMQPYALPLVINVPVPVNPAYVPLPNQVQNLPLPQPAQNSNNHVPIMNPPALPPVIVNLMGKVQLPLIRPRVDLDEELKVREVEKGLFFVKYDAEDTYPAKHILFIGKRSKFLDSAVAHFAVEFKEPKIYACTSTQDHTFHFTPYLRTARPIACSKLHIICQDSNVCNVEDWIRYSRDYEAVEVLSANNRHELMALNAICVAKFGERQTITREAHLEKMLMVDYPSMYYVPIEGDGNCVYSAYSVVSGHPPDDWAYAREELFRSLTKNEHDFMKQGNMPTLDLTIKMLVTFKAPYILIRGDAIVDYVKGHAKYHGIIVISEQHTNSIKAVYHCDTLLKPTHPTIRKPETVDFKTIKFHKMQLFSTNDRYEINTRFSSAKNILSVAAASFVAVEAHEPTIKYLERAKLVRTEAEIALVNGAAGCGKTMMAVLNATPQNYLFIASSKAVMEEYKNEVLKKHLRTTGYLAKTFMMALGEKKEKENYKLPTNSIDIVVIDEALRQITPYIIVIAQTFPLAKIVLLGGSDQMVVNPEWYPDFNAEVDDLSVCEMFRRNGVDIEDPTQVTINRITRRHGPATVEWLRRMMGQNFILFTNNAMPTTFTVLDDRDIDIDTQRLKQFPLLIARKDDLEDNRQYYPKIMTVSGSQGISKDTVILHLDDSTVNALNKHKDALYVACSRHKREIVLLMPSGRGGDFCGLHLLKDTSVGGSYYHLPTAQTIEEKGMDEQFIREAASTQPIIRKPTLKKYDALPHARCYSNKKFDLLALHDTLGLSRVVDNDIESMIFDVDEITEGTVSMSRFIDAQYNIIATTSLRTAKRQYQKSKNQEMHTFFGRLFKAHELKKFQEQKFKNADIREMVRKVSGTFFSSYIDPKKYEEALNEFCFSEEQAAEYNNFLSVMNISKMDVDATNRGIMNTLKGHLKQQAKTKDWETAWKNKGGQPVAAMEKSMNIMFSVFFRVMRNLLKSSLKDNILIADGCSDLEISNWWREKLAGHEGTAWFGEGDAEEFDAAQQKHTQIFEIALESFFCYDQELLETFHMFRNSARLRTWMLSMLWPGNRPSGAPDTMFGNILVMMTLVCMLFKKEEMLFCNFKGDDSLILFDRSIATTDQTFFGKIFNKPLKFQMKEDVGEFCNFWFSKEAYVYSPLCFFGKITNKNFKLVLSTKENFAEYRDSLRPLLAPVASNFWGAVKIIMIKMQCSSQVAQFWLEQMEAYYRIPHHLFMRELALEDFELKDSCVGLLYKIEHDQCKMERKSTTNNQKKKDSPRKEEKESKTQKKKRDAARRNFAVAATKINNRDNPRTAIKPVARKVARSAPGRLTNISRLAGRNLLENIAMPTSTTCPVQRMVDREDSVATAVAMPYAEVDWITDADGNVTFYLFRDMIRNLIYPTNNAVTCEYDAYFEQTDGTVSINFILSASTTDENQNFPVPINFAKYRTGDVIHGVYLGVGTIKNTERRFIWVDNGALLRFSAGTFLTGYTYSVKAYVAFEDGERVFVEKALTANAVTSILDGSQPGGYYAFEYFCPTVGTSPTSGPTISVDISYQEVFAFGHRMCPSLTLHIGSVETSRIIGTDMLLTNATAELTNNGLVAGIQTHISGGWQVLTADSTSVYPLVVELNGNQSREAKKGAHLFLRPTGTDAFNWNVPLVTNAGGLTLASFDLYPQTFGVLTVAANETQTLNGRLKWAMATEYQTNDTFLEKVITNMDWEYQQKILNEVKKIPQFTSNSDHISQIFGAIAKGVKDAASWMISNKDDLISMAKGLMI